MNSDQFYSKSVPVSGSYDVVVCGGGPAGIAAAIAAAEGGARTALIERCGFLGGMATAGYVNPMSEFAYNGKRIGGGIPWRFAQAMIEAHGAQLEEPRCNLSFSPEAYKLVAYRMVSQAGVTLYMNSYLADCIQESNQIHGVLIVNKSGMQIIRGKYFIDATGDADLAHFAQVPMLPATRAAQPASLCFCLSDVDTTTERMHIIHQKNHRFNHQAVFIREPLLALREQGVHVPQFGGPWLATTVEPGCITVNMTRTAIDATDSEDLQRGENKMREDIFCLVELLKKHIPEFKNCKLTAVSAAVGIRESRRIAGVHILTGEEYLRAHRFPDSIARACHPVDIHLPGSEGQLLQFPDDAGYIPYRCLITPSHPNLLVAGRAISADAEAFAAIRVQVPCMETGQAAGAAAAICLGGGSIPVQALPVQKLVDTLRQMGSCI